MEDVDLRVEIWSDVACPFCWLGKRRFEEALRRFEWPDRVQVEWKSFQLNPALLTDPTVPIHEHLARAKGVAPAVARGWNEKLAETGRSEGLAYDFDRIVVANTFDAHRLIQMAKASGLQDEAEERIFRGYFGEGRNVADPSVLAELGAEIGLQPEAVVAALAGGDYADAVRADIAEARELGIDGVPFFVIDRRYGVSGAQDPETFIAALSRAMEDRLQSPGTAAVAPPST